MPGSTAHCRRRRTSCLSTGPRPKHAAARRSWSSSPSAVVVVCHQGRPVEVPSDLLNVNLRCQLLARGHRRREQVVLVRLRTICIELTAKFRKQCRVVRRVFRPVDIPRVAGPRRILPVEVDAVEHPSAKAGDNRRRVAGIRLEVALDELINTRRHGLRSGRPCARSIRKLGRPRPTAERHQHLQLRILRLELFQLLEVPEEVVERRIRLSVNRLVRLEDPLVVGPRVTHAGFRDLEAAVLVDVAERLVDRRQFGRRAAGVDVLRKVVAVKAPHCTK